jgi:acyl dehydratase
MSSRSTGSDFLNTWTQTSSHVVNSVLEANRAAFAAFGVESGPDDDGPEVAAEEEFPTWEVRLDTATEGELAVGDAVEFSKTVSDADVKRFAASSGDTNPLHLDEEFASQTRFKGRIAHGTLVGGLISAALARLPGLTIYLSQDLEFHAPVRIGDRATAECEVVEDLGRNQYRLTTTVYADDEVVIDGEAVVLIDERPD